jgi:hypothetical protein
MRRAEFCAAAFAAVLGACSSPPPQELPRSAPAAAVIKPADQSRHFPLADQVRIDLLDNHLLGKDYLPGGNVAEYRRKGGTYRQFLVRGKSPQDAALLMFEFKGHLRDPKYLPHMGGYFGMDGTEPVYLFQKADFFAGFVGLPEKDADPLARQFAARLN